MVTNSIKKNTNLLNIICSLFLTAYSISLVIFVNNVELTFIENYFGYLVLLGFLILVLSRKKFYFPNIYISFAIFLILSVLVLFNNQNNVSTDLLISLIQIYLFSIIVCNILVFTNSSFSIEIGIIIGLFYSIFIGYYFGRDYFTGFESQRYAGTLSNPNHYSFMLTVALLFLTRRYFIFNSIKNKFSRAFRNLINLLIISTIILLSIEVVFFTMSRQGFIIVSLLLGYFIFQTMTLSNFVNKIFFLLVITIIIFLSSSYLEVSNILYNRISSLFSLIGLSDSSNFDYSMLSRTRYINDAFNLWTKNPLFGVGLHQFYYVNQSGVSHNNFLEILVNNGLFGFVAYYSLYIYFLLSSIRIRKVNLLDSNWILVVLIMLIIADMTVLTYMEKPNWMIFSIVMYVIYSNRKKSFTKFTLNN